MHYHSKPFAENVLGQYYVKLKDEGAKYFTLKHFISCYNEIQREDSSNTFLFAIVDLFKLQKKIDFQIILFYEKSSATKVIILHN